MSTITTIHKILDEDFNEEYFFSTNHCQPNLEPNWVPVTRYNTTREDTKRMIERKNDTTNAFSREIPNPNQSYQA